jgi:fumarate hydratase class II
MRTESDSMGTIEVPDEVYWGAQTAEVPLGRRVSKGSSSGDNDKT